MLFQVKPLLSRVLALKFKYKLYLSFSVAGSQVSASLKNGRKTAGMYDNVDFKTFINVADVRGDGFISTSTINHAYNLETLILDSARSCCIV